MRELSRAEMQKVTGAFGTTPINLFAHWGSTNPSDYPWGMIPLVPTIGLGDEHEAEILPFPEPDPDPVPDPEPGTRFEAEADVPASDQGIEAVGSIKSLGGEQPANPQDSNLDAVPLPDSVPLLTPSLMDNSWISGGWTEVDQDSASITMPPAPADLNSGSLSVLQADSVPDLEPTSEAQAEGDEPEAIEAVSEGEAYDFDPQDDRQNPTEYLPVTYNGEIITPTAITEEGISGYRYEYDGASVVIRNDEANRNIPRVHAETIQAMLDVSASVDGKEVWVFSGKRIDGDSAYSENSPHSRDGYAHLAVDAVIRDFVDPDVLSAVMEAAKNRAEAAVEADRAKIRAEAEERVRLDTGIDEDNEPRTWEQLPLSIRSEIRTETELRIAVMKQEAVKEAQQDIRDTYNRKMALAFFNSDLFHRVAVYYDPRNFHVHVDMDTRGLPEGANRFFEVFEGSTKWAEDKTLRDPSLSEIWSQFREKLLERLAEEEDERNWDQDLDDSIDNGEGNNFEDHHPDYDYDPNSDPDPDPDPDPEPEPEPEPPLRIDDEPPDVCNNDQAQMGLCDDDNIDDTNDIDDIDDDIDDWVDHDDNGEYWDSDPTDEYDEWVEEL